MLQIVFFIFILSISAFCINLIFFLNDSYEYESYEIEKIRKEYKSKRNYCMQASVIEHKQDNSAKYPINSISKGIEFYNIDTKSDNKNNKKFDIINCA